MKTKIKLLVCAFLLLFTAVNIHSEPSETFESLSLGIVEQINKVKQCNIDLVSEITTIKNNNEYLKTINENDLERINSLVSLVGEYNQQIEQDSKKLIKQEYKIKFLSKLVLIGVILILMFIVVRVATFILKSKGINLPEWVDEIL